MRSDEWDKKERIPFDGMQEGGPTNDDWRKLHGHQHEFNNGKCIHCGKTREQLRSEW